MVMIITKKNVFETLAVGFLLFSTTGATDFARSTMTWNNLAMPVLLGGLSILIVAIYRIKIARSFYVLTFFYVMLCVAQFMYFGNIRPFYFVLYLFNFWVAYCFVVAFRERLFFRIENIISFCAGISFLIWASDVVLNGAIRSALFGIVLGQPYSRTIDTYVIFQTFINVAVDSTFPRNAGFAWEPGAFAVLCCFGLLVNFYRTRLSIRSNYGAIAMILGVLSTQSTTGYIILAVFILSKIWVDSRGLLRIALFPLCVLVMVLAAANLPFLQDKILNLLNDDLSQLAFSASQEWNYGEPIAAQRILSLRMDVFDYLNHPLIGYGGNVEEMYSVRYGLNIVSISGIGKILGRFGTCGAMFFVYSVLTSSFLLAKKFSVEVPVLLFAYIAIVSVSYSLIEYPLFLTLWMYGYFLGDDGRVAKISRSDVV